MRIAAEQADMSSSDDDPDRPRDREALAAQLDELEDTLTDLRGELQSEESGPPRPPRLGELLRFTEQYTIPTVIAILEATIQSLELLQRTLRLADPTRAAREESDAARNRLDQIGGEAGDQLAGALAELRTALSEADLPENPESRDLITDARDLTGEIEDRLRDAERTVSEQRSEETSGGVMIDVDDGGDGAGGDSGSGSGNSADSDSVSQPNEEPTADTASASVDVDAELESIKHELGDGDTSPGDADTASADAADETADDDPHDDQTQADADDPEPENGAADEDDTN